MNENFDYSQVPKNYSHCLNERCLNSSDCLRFQVALRADKNTTSFTVINPTYLLDKEGSCPYFKSAHMIRYAMGINHLLENLPLAKSNKVKSVLYKHFGRNMFYRIKNKQRLIHPTEQAFIKQTLTNEGLEVESPFDEFHDSYNWD